MLSRIFDAPVPTMRVYTTHLLPKDRYQAQAVQVYGMIDDNVSNHISTSSRHMSKERRLKHKPMVPERETAIYYPYAAMTNNQTPDWIRDGCVGAVLWGSSMTHALYGSAHWERRSLLATCQITFARIKTGRDRRQARPQKGAPGSTDGHGVGAGVVLVVACCVAGGRRLLSQ